MASERITMKEAVPNRNILVSKFRGRSLWRIPLQFLAPSNPYFYVPKCPSCDALSAPEIFVYFIYVVADRFVFHDQPVFGRDSDPVLGDEKTGNGKNEDGKGAVPFNKYPGFVYQQFGTKFVLRRNDQVRTPSPQPLPGPHLPPFFCIFFSFQRSLDNPLI